MFPLLNHNVQWRHFIDVCNCRKLSGCEWWMDTIELGWGTRMMWILSCLGTKSFKMVKVILLILTFWVLINFCPFDILLQSFKIDPILLLFFLSPVLSAVWWLSQLHFFAVCHTVLFLCQALVFLAITLSELR